MRGPKYPINLEPEELETLQKITRKHSEKSSIVLRAKMILRANAGEKYQDIAQKLEIQADIIRHWAKRWYDMRAKPVRERLQDLPRPGAPDTFTPEQLCQIIALACESPVDYGRPITHWTHRELAEEAIKQGIVDSISANYVGCLLKKTTSNPTAASTGSMPKPMTGNRKE